jgi:hypothetical protein
MAALISTRLPWRTTLNPAAEGNPGDAKKPTGSTEKS